MKPVRDILLVSALAALSITRAIPQQAVPPPPKPADVGPSLADTMNYIQDKLKSEAHVGYIKTDSRTPQLTERVLWGVSEALAYPASCSLRTVEGQDRHTDLQEGASYPSWISPLTTPEDLHLAFRERLEDISFKQIASIRVEREPDLSNRKWALQAQSITETRTPEYFVVTLLLKSPVTVFRSTTRGRSPGKDDQYSTKEWTYSFEDEEMAGRMAKAMLHAVELCGGGSSKDLF